MKLWGGRFSEQPDALAWALNSSLHFDRRLATKDVSGSQAWARALEKAGILTEEECMEIVQGLSTIMEEFESGAFAYQENDEDIHTAVERRLGEIIGPLAGKLHTGRSRNDQVATDFRMWLLNGFTSLDASLIELQTALVERAEGDIEVIMPGYTHLQHAQPILLSHWWLAHFWPLQRDRQRLSQLMSRTAVMPLGSGALAGTAFPIERIALAGELGFKAPCENSIDGVSDRDFAAEFLFFAALTGVHISRLAEAVVLFSSAEFNFFELSDAFSTGSSLMPQKKNPDVFELARGKSGALIGHLSGLLSTLKGLPSAYDKDLQEDKMPVFNAYDTLIVVFPVLTNAIRTLAVNKERMLSAIDPTCMTTDLADELVRRGIPFREAHHLIGQALRLAEKSGKPLNEMTRSELMTINQDLDLDMHDLFDPWRSVSQRAVIGGSAPVSVKEQIVKAQDALGRSY